MSSLADLPRKRKRSLAAKLTDTDNVAQPALKQQRLALEQCRKACVEDADDSNTSANGDTAANGDTSANGNTAMMASSPIPLDPECHLEPIDNSDNDVPLRTSAPGSRTAVVMLDSDDEDILKEFMPKKPGERRATAKVASTKESRNNETAEEELARLMKTWDSPIYGFYEPIPEIEDVNKCQSHVFQCAAVGCHHKVRHYLNTNDKGSTSNLLNHAKKCWGDEAFEKVYDMKDLSWVWEVVGKLKNVPNGNIAAMFSNLDAKGVVTYMHRQHTTEEARYGHSPFP
jgi:hypothetical protein